MIDTPSFFVNYKGYVTVSQTLSNYRPFHLAQRISSDHYISMALNIDLFKYYSEALEKNNEMIRLHKAKDEQKIVRKRKIFLEVEVSEDEYQAFMKQTK